MILQPDISPGTRFVAYLYCFVTIYQECAIIMAANQLVIKNIKRPYLACRIFDQFKMCISTCKIVEWFYKQTLVCAKVELVVVNYAGITSTKSFYVGNKA